MPLFHEPSHGPDEKLKIDLKRWERSFFRMNGRKPGKVDIEVAGEDVSQMYRKYWSLIKGHPLQSQSQKCNKKNKSDAKQPESVSAGPENQVKESSSSHVSASLPSGVWGDDLLKKNFNARPDQKVDENPILQPFLIQLRKLHLREDNIKMNISKGMFSLKRRKRPAPDPPADQMMDCDEPDHDSLTAAAAAFPPIASERVTVLFTPSESHSSHNHIYPEISPSSGFSSFSGSSSLKENDSSNHSPVQPPSGSDYPSIRLFDDDEDNSTENEIAKVKETFAEAFQEMVFDGCELLPIDFKKKKHKNPPTAKALKKRNDNFVRINMKKKSYASRGYKKLNVAKEKRKAHFKAKRDRCFTCGESGHWRHECPLINKPVGKKTPAAGATTACPASDAADESGEAVDCVADDQDEIPFLPEDYVIMTDTEEAI